MTPQEFKAWFDGFTEAMEGMPTEAQWAKIKLRVGEIDGRSVSYPVFVDRYWPRIYPHYRDNTPYWTSLSAGATTPIGQEKVAFRCGSPSVEFDSVKALYAAGRSDFEAVA
jgi:hypothetical protein